MSIMLNTFVGPTPKIQVSNLLKRIQQIRKPETSLTWIFGVGPPKIFNIVLIVYNF